MSEAPPAVEPGRIPRWAKIVLFVVLPALVLLAVGGIVLVSLALRGTSIAASDTVASGSEVNARLGNANIHFVPSDTTDVTVKVAGTYFGPRPTVTVDTARGVTSITGGCQNRWFAVCRLTVTVEVPPAVRVVAEGQNGTIRAEGLSGPLALTTRNGAIEATDTSGALSLRTVNGPVRVDGANSARVGAATVNGDVDLSFASAPERVLATTTNGPIVIEVPTDGVRYSVDATTVNGRVDSSEIPSHVDANRMIRASTTNGSITIVPADG